MYSIALDRISLDEFATMVRSVDLLPGRKILLDDLSGVMERLKQRGISHLGDLKQLLHDKKRYSELAHELAVSPQYLTVLNREINSYASTPLLLSKLDVFSTQELTALEKAGLKTTKNLYEQCLTKASRQNLSDHSGIPEDRLVEGLEISDLLRINGVGPVYAKILRQIGIKSAHDYLSVPSEEILQRFEKANEFSKLTQTRLGLKDVEYCKRFCKKLDNEVEW